MAGRAASRCAAPSVPEDEGGDGLHPASATDIDTYELAVVADDVDMGITEVVRGEDLLRSTARQLLVYRALGAAPPAWCHLPLVRDAAGRRLAKRHQAMSIRELRARGMTRAEVLALAAAGHRGA